MGHILSQNVPSHEAGTVHCAACRSPFQLGEFILWRARTREALHPTCCANRHPHLADWIAHAPRGYVNDFKTWMMEWKPHAFATFNLPNARRAPREETFYLNYWTRAAEADVLGARTVKEVTDFDRRIVWLCRRAVSPDELIHYHAIGRFPLHRPWRDERPESYSIVSRCERLERALRVASSRTPEPFSDGDGYQPSVADIDVRPFHAERHIGYLLNRQTDLTMPDNRDGSTDDALRDRLFILPHVPRPKFSPSHLAR
jgi:hypothetical protein